MTFNAAMKALADGYAIKVPTWAGYIKRVDNADSTTVTTTTTTDDTTTVTSSYVITFVCKSNYAASPTTYSYTYTTTNTTISGTTTTTSSVSATGSLILDTVLLDALQSSDWTLGKTSDYEGVRSSDTTW